MIKIWILVLVVIAAISFFHFYKVIENNTDDGVVDIIRTALIGTAAITHWSNIVMMTAWFFYGERLQNAFKKIRRE